MKTITTVTISQELARKIKNVTMVDEAQNIWNDIRKAEDDKLFDEVCELGLKLGMSANSQTLMYLVSTGLYIVKECEYWVVYGRESRRFYVRKQKGESWWSQVKIKKFDKAENADNYARELNELNKEEG